VFSSRRQTGERSFPFAGHPRWLETRTGYCLPPPTNALSLFGGRTDPSPVTLRLVKAPERDTLSPRGRRCERIRASYAPKHQPRVIPSEARNLALLIGLLCPQPRARFLASLGMTQLVDFFPPAEGCVSDYAPPLSNRRPRYGRAPWERARCPSAHPRCPAKDVDGSGRRVAGVNAYCLLPTAHCRLPTAHCLLPTASCLLPTAHCPLPTAHCPLPYCPLPTAFCLLPSAPGRVIPSLRIL
jgi:hypothetical protein